MKKFILSFLIAVISTVISFIAVEFTLRLLNSNNSYCINYNAQPFIDSRGFSLINSYYPPNSSVLHCNRDFSYTYHIDSNGLRSSNAFGSKILSIGDSFTFGFGVDDLKNYSSLIHSHNAGLWGNTFDSQFKSYLRNIEIIQPNSVVWTIYPPHLISMTNSNWSTNCPGDYELSLANSLSFFWTFIEKSNLNFLTNLELYKLALHSFGLFSINIDSGYLRFNRNCYETKEVILYDKNLPSTKYSNRIFESTLSSELNQSLLSFSKIFSSANKVALAKNIKLIIVLMPSKFYLSSREIDFTPPKYPGLLFDSNLAKAEIYNALIIAGIPEKNILDLSAIEELKGNKWRRYYFLHDAHLNEDGNHLVAGYISRKLRGN